MRKLGLTLFVTLIVLAAGAARWHALGAQSLWYDEGVAYRHSLRSLAEMIPLLQNNVHVPAYFGALALWEDLVGASEFSLRALSVLFSLLSVAFSFALGKRLYGNVAGVVAAGVVALNSFSVYYAQEARMYAMLAAISACAMWAFVGFIQAYHRQEDSFAPAILLAATNTLGMYTHFSYALTMVAQGVLAVLWLLAVLVGSWRVASVPRRAPKGALFAPAPPLEGFQPVYTLGTALRALLLYVVVNLITIALFFPWLEIAIRQTGAQPNISDALSTPDYVRLLFGWLTFGKTYEVNAGGMTIVAYFFLLFGLTLPPSQRKASWWYMLVPVVWVLVAVALYSWQELYARYLRFLLPAQLAVALWIGRGAWVLWHIQTRERRGVAHFLPRVAVVFSVAAFWVVMAQGLPPLYDDARYQRDNYRGLAQVIATQATPSDSVILSAAGLRDVFGYYYRGLATVYGLPASGDPRENTLSVISNSRRVFAVFYGEQEQDPNRVIERTLNMHAYPIVDTWWGDLRAVRYANPPLGVTIQPHGARFGDHITLQEAGVSATTLKPDDTLFVALHWQTDAPLATRYKVFVQLLNADGALVAQRDSEPMGNLAPTTTWQPNTTVIDHHALELGKLPAGAYRLIVGLYDANNPAQRLPTTGGDFVTLATLQLES